MFIRNSSASSNASNKARKRRQEKQRRAARHQLLLESLESRILMATVGPVLAGIQPNSGDLLALDGSGVRDIAPRELTFRFDENQQIDTATLAGIRILRSNLDGVFGGVAVTDFNTAATATPVTVRFAAVNNDDQNVSLTFTKSDHAATGKLAGPIITVAGTTVSVDLDTNAAGPTKAIDLVGALNANSAAKAILTATIASGNPNANIAAPTINYSPLPLVNNDVLVTPGYKAVSAAPNQNEVIVRFAETLPDDWYRIELFGMDDPTRGLTALRNENREAFGDTTDDNVDNGLRRQVVDFRLALGAQVVAVVPQPVTRITDPANSRNTILSQARNQIVVYFNSDPLFIEHDAANQPTARSADHPHFYRLILTRDSVENTDDVTILPKTVAYDPVAHTATLTFQYDLDQLRDPADGTTILGPGTFRLRVGTNEELPTAPIAAVATAARPQASSDFGTGGAVNLVFQGTDDFAEAVNLNFSRAALGVDSGGLPKLPTVTLSGHELQVVLNTDGGGTTAAQLKTALEAVASRLLTVTIQVSLPGYENAPIIGSSVQRLRLVGLGSSFDTAGELGQLTAQNVLLTSSIDAQVFPLDLPGGPNEPGHRQVSASLGDGFEQHVNPDFGPSQTAGLTTILYNFRQIYGVDSRGQSLTNAISEKQKQRVREAVQLWSQRLGVQFLETADQGLTFVTGDPVALDPNDPHVVNHAGLAGGGTNYNFIVRVDPTYANGMVIMDSQRRWNEDYGGDWFTRAMVGVGFALGLGRANDLPPSNLMAFDNIETYAESLDSFFNKAGAGVPDPEPVYPGNADILHGQYLHPTTSNDIDLYRFEINLNDQNLDEPKHGLFTAEAFAQRQPNASLLDTILSLYQEVPITDKNGVVTGTERQLIARNDDYYGKDSFLSLDLSSGTYYLGVTSKGNTDFDPTIEDTGFGGTTEGSYQVRLNFRPQVAENDVIRDLDRDAQNRPGTALDGNADGVPGGVYNFWFQTRSLQRTIEVTADGNRYVDEQTVTLTDGAGQQRRFEFDQVELNNGLIDPSAIRIPFNVGVVATSEIGMAMTLANAINAAGFGVQANLSGPQVVLDGDRVTALSADTEGIHLLGKTIFVDKTSGSNLNGSLAKPFDNIAVALAASVPGDIVRVEGNGGADGNALTLRDNFAYELGFGLSGGSAVLTDGDTLAVPQGVTLMVDAGAIFKLRRSSVGVGSTSLSVDHSGGALQVLGTPRQSVYFTSWLDESIGRDTYAPPTTPGAGDWGGLMFKADLDDAESRYNAEDQGIFLNYVNHADIRYGGSGQVVIDGVQQIVTPIQVFGMRPTLTFNSITKSSDSAISADPDSFEETNFHSPRYQLATPFTSDYQRVGPEIHNNSLIGNSINGLFVRIQTPAATEIKTLTVPARFDDTDITHVIAENLAIDGTLGVPLVDETRPDIDLVSISVGSGGLVPVGKYAYKLVFVDRNGFEGRPSEATQAVNVAVSGAVTLDYLPTIPAGSDYIARRLYRGVWNPVTSQFESFALIGQLNASDTSFVDPSQTATQPLERDPLSVRGVSAAARSVLATTGAVGVSPGEYNYRAVLVTDGQAGPASDASVNVTVPPAAGAAHVVVVDLAGLPVTPIGSVQRIYRSAVGGVGPYTLVGEINPGQTTWTDSGTVRKDAQGAAITLDAELLGVVRARPNARLKIDPGTVVKLEGSRIEVSFGAQLIAEGNAGQEIIFTSKLDDRYGGSGSFDTNNDDGANENGPQRGDWGGLFISPLGKLSLDHAYVAYGGGNDVKIESTFKGFNVIELRQAEARIANSVIEQNANGTGGQGPATRFGRGANRSATIFVQGEQPTIVNNIIRNNDDVAISINADTLTADYLPDPGRETGQIEVFAEYRDNQGPLIRGNRIADNASLNANGVPFNGNSDRGLNGLEVRTAGINNILPVTDVNYGALAQRGITLSTASVWDDTDIVHFLYDEIRVQDSHSHSSLRLQSNPTESLVIKLQGAANVNQAWNFSAGSPYAYGNQPYSGAGFTATGRQMDIEDRVGGTMHIIGAPGFPVVLTSIHDDTVGAGLQPDGTAQTDSNNNGIASHPTQSTNGSPYWRSVRLDQFTNDRNVEIIMNRPTPAATQSSATPTQATAQYLGDLAGSETSSDDNLRLGFEVHSVLTSPGDIDVYSVTAVAGTEIWLDIYGTDHKLDTVIDILNSNGRLIAQSDNSLDESQKPNLLYADTTAIPRKNINPLQKLADVYQPLNASGLPKEFLDDNPLDAGLRVVVPGAAGVRTSFLFRVRSSNLAAGDAASQLRDASQVADGLTSGSYVLQVRMREQGEVPGSTIRYADIRYATNGIETYGLPGHSPLLGEAAEDNVNNDNLVLQGTLTMVPEDRPQYLGNLLTSDRAVQSIAGNLEPGTDVDIYQFSVQHTLVSDPSPQHAALTFDMDYADGLSRADTTLTVFDSQGRPILIGLDSNIAEDQPLPVADPQDPSGLKDLSRGSAGERDPFIGTVELPEGTYYVAVTSNQRTQEQIPEYINGVLNPAFNNLLRREPINSVVRIAEDHIDPLNARFAGSTAAGPLVPVLLDPAFDGTTSSAANLWHVSTREAATAGHGVNQTFDRSRISAVGVGTVNQALGNKTIATAQTLETVLWSLAANANIGGVGTDTSSTYPHVSITNDPTNAGGTFNYYSFEVPHAGARALFDIDGVPALGTAGRFDAVLFLYDTAGNLLASSDNLPGATVDAGSVQVTDSLLDFTFPAAGAYVIGVARSGSVGSPGGITGVPLQTGDTYQLHVSVQDHPSVTTVPTNGGQTFYFGREATGNYAIGQRATGSLTSNEFSLAGYAAGDRPVLYFNYLLDSDSNGNGPDAFRVYVGDAAGNEALLGSSLISETGLDVKRLSDAAAWRQIRLSLDAFAGKERLHVRFAFDSGDANNSPFAEGVHIDDVIIGFAEHGEMITGARASTGNSPFVANPDFVSGATVDGPYQLEIRRSTEYGQTISHATGAPLILQQAFDTNDRLAQQVTLVAPSGYKLTDGQTFTVSDGLNTVTLEYNNTSLPNSGGGVRAGNARIDFVPADTDYVIARRIRDVINSPSVQGVLEIQAANADGTVSSTTSTDNRINLFGNAAVSFTPVAEGTVAITGSTANANDLRDRLLGTTTGLTVGNAAFTGGVNATTGNYTSAGFFTGGASSIGFDSGIILSTGDATVANGPNLLENSSGLASGLGDTNLNSLFGVTTRDTTSLEFPFQLTSARTLYFNFVFASEEYNESVGAANPDAFAILVTNLATGTVSNLAVVPGKTTPISRNTVNGGNPLGAGGVNAQYYRNNSLANGGDDVAVFGFDGFTDVFTAQTALPAGNYKIKFVISDVGGQTGDSAVLLQARSFGTVNPAPATPAIYGVRYDGFGDANHFRDQGQLLIHSNTITAARDYGIVVDAGERDAGSSSHPVKLGQSHAGPVRNLGQLNDLITVGAYGGLAPGATIVNNTISGEGLGGIHFSGNLTPYELTTRRPAVYPLQNFSGFTAGDAVSDGEQFSITAYGTTVTFEFEDISGSPVPGGGSGVLGGNGWTNGNIPIFYRRTHATPFAAYHPLINPARAGRTIGYTQQEMAIAIGDAIRGSILVSNDTTLVADAILGSSRSIGGDPATGTPTAGDPAVFIEHASQVAAVSGGGGLARIRTLPLAPASQPFGRIVNNTIYGHDGTSSFTTSGPLTTEPNDTIFSAVDTKQGRAQNPQSYVNTGVLGDSPSMTQDPSQDVDFFQFQMDIGDRLVLRVAGTAAQGPLNPYVRLFDELGQAQQPLTYTTSANGVTVDVIFVASKAGTYCVGISGQGNEEYSPLSLGGRQHSDTTGTYSIDLNVLAPHDYVITVDNTYAAGTSFRIQDVTGTWVTYTFGGNIGITGRHPQIAKRLEQVLGQGLSGVSAEAFGGLSQGLSAKQVDASIASNFERYVIIRGAARVEDINSGIRFRPGGDENFDEFSDGGTIRPERGILISEQSSPTLLNNVLVNNWIGVQQVGRAPFTAIEGASIYQYNASSNSNVSQAGWDFNIQVPAGSPFFVNAADGNFYPAPLSRAIDSSVDSLEDRPQYISVKALMGIANSPILAPDRDASGQLRFDDPAVAPPQGQGANVFKDRGSLDRADFKGPHAELVIPLDNDGAGLDHDPTTTVVQLTAGVYDDFRIQVVDGFEAADPFPGVGVNNATVLGPNGPDGRLPGAVVTLFEDGRFLQEELDYTYRYDSTSHTIILSPTAGIWPDGKVYVVKLNNRDRFVINVPEASDVTDGDQFRITDDSGRQATFEFDSGYLLHVPATLALQVPAAGAGPGSVFNGQRFVISDGAVLPGVTFEMVLTGGTAQSGNIGVPFGAADTQAQIANTLVAAFNSTAARAQGLFLQAKVVAGQPGLIHLGAPSSYSLDLISGGFTSAAATWGLRVSPNGVSPAGVRDADTFTVSDGTRSVTFEFDSNRALTVPTRQRVDISRAVDSNDVADAIVRALQAAVAADLINLLSSANLGNGAVFVGCGELGNINLAGANASVTRVHVSNPTLDGETFTVRYDDDRNAATASVDRTFEFDSDGLFTDVDGDGTPDNKLIAITPDLTAEEVAVRIAAAVRAETQIDLPAAQAIGDGVVQLAGTRWHDLLTPNSGRPAQTGAPDVTTSTTLQLPGLPTIVLPASGGLDIFDQETFTIADGVIRGGRPAITFQFHNLDAVPDVPVVLPNVAIDYHAGRPGTAADSAAVLAQAVAAAINNQNMVIDPTQPPGGGNQLVATVIDGKDVQLSGAAGYTVLTVPAVPPMGSVISQTGGRIQDGETFIISVGTTSVTFEFDENGRPNSALNTVILYNRLSTIDQIANALVTAVGSVASLQLNPVNVGNGGVQLADTAQYRYDARLAPDLTITGTPGGAIPVAFTPAAGTVYREQLLQAMVAAINGTQTGLGGVSASLRGGDTIFVDFLNATDGPADFVNGQAAVTGISSYFLRAIQDIPGNWLTANQSTNQTQFTILMPGAVLDYGDARATTDRPAQYPTLLTEDGARHVITPYGPYLGDRVDGNPDGQPVPAGVGDEVDHWVDLRDSALTITRGDAPYSLQVPNAVPDGKTFFIQDNTVSPTLRVTFEFDTDDSVVDTTTHKGVHYAAGASKSQIAAAIVQAVANAGLGLQPADLGSGTVYLGGRQLHMLDAGTSRLALKGAPVYQLQVDPVSRVQDGQTFTVSDGVYPVPTIFEFDNDGSVGTGHEPIPFLPADDEAAIARAIRTAVSGARNVLGQPLALTLTDLEKGVLQVVGSSSHTLDMNSAETGLSVATRTPLVLTTPAAGLGYQLAPALVIRVPRSAAGGVVDGQTFTIGDPTHVVTFEFDSNHSLVNSQARSIAFQPFDSAITVATAIQAAILQATTVLPGQDPSLGLPGLNPLVDNSDPADILVTLTAGLTGDALRATAEYRLNTAASGLKQNESVAAGQDFFITENGAGARTVQFVFDDLSDMVSVTPGPTVQAVGFWPYYSANDVVNAMAAGIAQALTDGKLTGVAALSLGAARLQVGGAGAVTAGGTGQLLATGVAQGVLDGQTFDLLDGLQTRRFEFDADGQTTPGNIIVRYDVTQSADDIAKTIAKEVGASGYTLSVLHLPGTGNLALNGSDDDGVRLDGVLTPGVTVPVTIKASAQGYLNGWIDFNSDGDWTDQYENVFPNVLLQPGMNRLLVTVPINAGLGETFARFRISSQGGLQPTGLATDGEVEDYRLEIVSNDVPQLTVPVSLTTAEDVRLPLNGSNTIQVVDADAATGTMTVRLSVLHGELHVNNTVPGGVILANINGNDSAIVTLAGTLQQINATLAAIDGLSYLNSPLNFNGNDLLTVVVDDGGNTGTGGPQHSFQTIPITVVAVNDAPTVSISAPTLTLDEGVSQSAVAPGIQVADVDLAANSASLLTVTLSIPALTPAPNAQPTGTITVTPDLLNGVPGSQIVQVSPTEIQLTGTLSQLNTTLATGVKYQVPDGDYNDNRNGGPLLLTVVVNDQGHTGASLLPSLSGSGTVTIYVTPVNDAPQVTAPAGQQAIDVNDTLTFSATNTPANDIRIADRDAGETIPEPKLQVTLTAASGVLTLGRLAGLDFSGGIGDGTADATMVFLATLNDINAALDGLIFTPTLDYAGIAASVTVTVNDLGATGTGPIGGLVDAATIPILVRPVPTLDPIADMTVLENVAGTQTIPYRVNLTGIYGSAGNFSTVASVAVSSDNPALIPTPTLMYVLGSQGGFVEFVPAADQNTATSGTAVITVKVTNTGLTDSSGQLIDGTVGEFSRSFTVTITPVNGAPLRTAGVPVAITANEDSAVAAVSLVLGGLTYAPGTVTATDEISPPAPQTLSYTMTSIPAAITLWLADGITPVLQGDVLPDLAALQGLKYKTVANAHGVGTLSWTVTDSGSGVTPDANTLTEQLTVTINELNDVPVRTAGALAAIVVNEDSAVSTPVSLGLTGLDYASGPADEAGQTRTYRLTAIPPAITVWLADGITEVTAGTALADLPALQGLTYKTVADARGTGNLTWTVTDSGSGVAPNVNLLTENLSITVTAVNDPPVRRAGTLADISVAEDSSNTATQSLGLGSLQYAGGPTTATDELGQTLTYRIISIPPMITVWLANGTTQVATGTTLNNLVALQGLRFKTVANANGTGNLTWTVTDDGTPKQTLTENLSITVTEVNDMPVRTGNLGPNISRNEDSANTTAVSLGLTGLTYKGGPATAVDEAAQNLTYQITTVPPMITLWRTSGATQIEVLAGDTLPDLVALQGLLYKTVANAYGIGGLTWTVTDDGTTNGQTDPKTLTESLLVTVTAVNDAPKFTASPVGPLTVAEDTDLIFASPRQINVFDVDVGEGTLSLTLQVDLGSLTLNDNVSNGLGAANIQNNRTANVVLIGTPAQINATLNAADGLIYRPTLNLSGLTDTLRLTLNDQGNGPLTTPPTTNIVYSSVAIQIMPVNDRPVITLPSLAPWNEDTSVALPIVVTDVEIGSAAIWTTTLQSNNGTFTVRADIAGGVTQIGGSPGSSVTLIGTGLQTQATLLSGVAFTPNLDFNGAGSLTVTIVDAGVAPALPVTVPATLSFSVSAVNDGPVVTLPNLPAVGEDSNLAIGGPTGMTVVDVDSGNAPITVTMTVLHGTLTVKSNVGGGLLPTQIVGNASGQVVLTGTVQAISNTLADIAGAVYRGLPNYSGSDTLTVSANDGGNTGSGGARADLKSTSIVVNGVNDPPYVAHPLGTLTVAEDAADRVIELYPDVFNDADSSPLNFTVISNSNPNLVTAMIPAGETKLYLHFLPNANGSASIAVTASDGANSATDILTLNVTPVNDPPFVANRLPNLVVPAGTGSQVVDLGPVFRDADLADVPPDVLTLSFNNALAADNSNPALVTGTLAGDKLTLNFQAGQVGSANLTVHATDRAGVTVANTFTVKVNRAPVANPDPTPGAGLLTTAEDTPLQIFVYANDTDVDGTLKLSSVTIVTQPLHGTVVVNADGVVTYTPAANYPNRAASGSGTDSFSYELTDNDGARSNAATVTVSVTEVPDYQNPNASLREDVNKDGYVSPIDALLVINYINAPTPTPSPGSNLPADPIPPAQPLFYYDVDGNNQVESRDVLRIINKLNTQNSGAGEGEAALPSAQTVAGDVNAASGMVDGEANLTAPVPLAAVAFAAPRLAVASSPLAPATPSQAPSLFESLGQPTARLAELDLDDVLADIAAEVDSLREESLADLALSSFAAARR